MYMLFTLIYVFMMVHVIIVIIIVFIFVFIYFFKQLPDNQLKSRLIELTHLLKHHYEAGKL